MKRRSSRFVIGCTAAVVTNAAGAYAQLPRVLPATAPAANEPGGNRGASLIDVVLEAPTTWPVATGTNVRMLVTNNAAFDQLVTAGLRAEAASYRGDSLGTLRGISFIPVLIEAGETLIVEITVTETAFNEYLRGYNYIRLLSFVLFEGEFVFSNVQQYAVEVPDVAVDFEPEATVELGGVITGNGSYTNPLTVPLTNVSVIFMSQNGGRFGGGVGVRVPVADIPVGGSTSAGQLLRGALPGDSIVQVQVVSDEIIASGTGTIEATCILATCDGDADFNGTVDLSDINSVLSHWLATYAPTCPPGPGDADRNGIVEFGDVNSVLQHWAETCP